MITTHPVSGDPAAVARVEGRAEPRIAEPEDAVMGVAGEREPEIAGTVVLAPEALGPSQRPGGARVTTRSWPRT